MLLLQLHPVIRFHQTELMDCWRGSDRVISPTAISPPCYIAAE